MHKVAGTFWIDRDRKIGGILELAEDDFRLELENQAFKPDNYTIGPDSVAIGSSPRDITEDHTPRVIHGVLADGATVTLLDAHFDDHSFWTYPRQQFTGTRYLIGAHIDGVDQACSGIRWTFNFPKRLAGWLDDPAASVHGSALGGLLSAWTYEGSPGVELQMDVPHALNVTDVCVVGAMTQLLTLWTNKAISVGRIEVQLEGAGWCRYGNGNETGTSITRTDLLPLDEVALETFAKWLPVATVLEPLPYIASFKSPILQVGAQVATTAIEGLHSRLQGLSQRNFEPASKRAVQGAVTIAANAGANALLEAGYPDGERAKRLIREALGHVDSPGYRQRATELATAVVEIAPGLCGPDLASWVKYATSIRNEQSHQTLESFSDSYVTKYLIISISTTWVLKIRILLEVVSSERLHLALHQSQGFQFALANMDLEHHWEDFSCLSTFRNTRSA